ERWGDPRSSRSLRLGPPPGATAPLRRSGAVRGSWARDQASRARASLGLLAVTWTDGASALDRPLPPEREAELVRARELAEAHPRLDHLLVPGGPEALPYAELVGDPLSGPLTDEPAPALVTSLRDRARLAEAGADHLTGHGARHVLDGHPARMADLLTARQRGSLVRPVTALVRTSGAPVSLLRAARQLARGSYAEGLEDAATRLVAGPVPATTDALVHCAPGPAASWLTQEACAAVAVRLRLAARRPAPGERPGARRARLALERKAAELRVLAQVVESADTAHGQRLHAPFLDNQVIRACRQVPDAARTQPGARREILRAVLAGAGVPEGPADATPSPPPGPGPSATVGLTAAARGVESLFTAPVLGELGLLDVERFRAALAGHATMSPAGQEAVAQVVATELWLRRLRSRRGTSWQGLPPAPRPEVAAAP
ncbi:asparagine synthase-related protein, partial [Streptacidiphilus monticola]